MGKVYFGPKRRKNPTQLGGTYLYGLYKGLAFPPGGGRGEALGYFLGAYVPPGTPNWHPVLKQNSPKIDTPF